MLISHPFEPVFSPQSQVLILGSFPSPVSRLNYFYYSHPQNRFWKIMASLFKTSVPSTPTEKQNFLLSQKIALWDVLAACDVDSAADSEIKSPVPNDFSRIISETKIAIPCGKIFTTGKRATHLYQSLCFPQNGIQSIYLPSTSSANAQYSLQKLLQQYEKLLEYL